MNELSRGQYIRRKIIMEKVANKGIKIDLHIHSI